MRKTRYFLLVAMVQILALAFAHCLSAQQASTACQVNKVLLEDNERIPSPFHCQANPSCTAYITCAFEEEDTNHDAHKSDMQWHIQLVGSVAAILERLPSGRMLNNAEYYREFFAIVWFADQPSDKICIRANLEIQKFAPALRAEGSLPYNQGKLVEGARYYYKNSKCYDSDLFDKVTTPVPNEAVVALLSKLLTGAGHSTDIPGNQTASDQDQAIHQTSSKGGPPQ